MKKLIIILSICILLIGCSESSTDLPPPPGSPGGSGSPVGEASVAFDQLLSVGYAPPYNIFDNDAPMFVIGNDESDATIDFDTFTITPGQQNLKIFVKSNIAGGYVWGVFPISNKNKPSSSMFDLDKLTDTNVHTPLYVDDPTQSKRFYTADSGGGFIDVDVSTLNIGGDNFILSYVCKNYPNLGGFKCGCITQDACNRWSLHAFTVIEDTPQQGCGFTGKRCTADGTKVEECQGDVIAIIDNCQNGCTSGICNSPPPNNGGCTLGEQKCADDKMSLLECDGTSFIYKKDCIFNFGFVAPGCSEVDENNNPISPPDCFNT